MANFKPGMKVKRVRDPRDTPAYATAMPIGATGTVSELDGEHVRVVPDGEYGRTWGCEPSTLEPLTDPRASEFIADMNRFSKLSENSHA